MSKVVRYCHNTMPTPVSRVSRNASTAGFIQRSEGAKALPDVPRRTDESEAACRGRRNREEDGDLVAGIRRQSHHEYRHNSHVTDDARDCDRDRDDRRPDGEMHDDEWHDRD